MTNPYSAPAATNPNPSPNLKPRWVQSVLILNATLVGIPLVIGTIAFLWAQLWTAWENAMSSSDPVAFQHFYFIQVTPLFPWVASAYFLIPNGILVGSLLQRRLAADSSRVNQSTGQQ